MDPLIGGQCVTSVTRSGLTSAVQNILNGQIDFLATAISCDFDSVGQGREGCMGPAGSAVLGDVLVQVFGDVGGPVYVAPVPFFGKLIFGGVSVGEG